MENKKTAILNKLKLIEEEKKRLTIEFEKNPSERNKKKHKRIHNRLRVKKRKLEKKLKQIKQ